MIGRWDDNATMGDTKATRIWAQQQPPLARVAFISHRRLPSSPIVEHLYSPPAAYLCVTPENFWGLEDQYQSLSATLPDFVLVVCPRVL